VVGELPVNSLLQRIGRVGRKRPGIAYISQEVGAAYSGLDDNALNSAGTLDYEPIRFPLATAPLLPLAYYAAGQEWTNFYEWLAELGLPSRIEEDRHAVQRLSQQFPVMEELGIISIDGRLTDFGRRMRPWVGRVDLAYAVKLQRSIEEDAEMQEIVFWAISTALCQTPITALRAKHGFFVDYNESHKAVSRAQNVWDGGIGLDHEDLAQFSMFCVAAERFAPMLFGHHQPTAEQAEALERWCNRNGVYPQGVRTAAKLVSDNWRLLQKASSKKLPSLMHTPWYALLKTLPSDSVYEQLLQLTGFEEVTLIESDGLGFTWKSGERSGVIRQDDTPVELLRGDTYRAKLLPSQESLDSAVTWRLANICQLPPPPEPVQEVTEEEAEEPLPRGWRKLWKWLFG
jgi:hypothetical protein